MNRILDIGYCLSVPERNDGNFIIKKVLGKGASSVTYLAESDKTEHVLKECNPLGLHMHRDENGFLVPDTELNRAKFEEYLKRFNAGVDKQLEFRLTDALKNTISNIQNIYHANGTVYVDMTFLTGATYDQIKDDSLHNLLKRMKALAEHIGHYHDMGYLHLDIKPQNIYTIPETPEMVIMFDFDSVVLEKDVEKTVFLSYTDSWAAPEQKMAKYRSSICKATDLFAIGEIIFYRVMGRHSNLNERFDFSKYVYDKEDKIFENVNPQVFRLLDELFHKTICCAPSQRFQTAAELIAQLDKLIPLADPKAPYLVTTIPAPKDFFIGRDAEIEDIHARLQQSPVLFLHGIGGIGKSELAKQYAKKYRGEYDTIVFAPYITDIVSMIADDTYVRINHFNRGSDQSIEDYYEKKLGKIKDLTSDIGDRILFLVDNFDTADDPHTNVLTELGCRVLFTSRMDFSDAFAQIDLNAIANPFAIFDEYYKKPLSDAERNMVSKIIDIVGGHTMTIELLAKQMMASRITPERMLAKLSSSGLRESGKEKVRSTKDGNLVIQSTFEHIQALFDLADLNEDEKYVLANLSLIPYTGISTELFGEWCEIDNYDTINQLAVGGWIRWDKTKDYISLHPIVADIANSIIVSNCEWANNIYYSCESYLEELSHSKKISNMEYFLPFCIAETSIKIGIDSIEFAELLSLSYWNMIYAYTRPEKEVPYRIFQEQVRQITKFYRYAISIFKKENWLYLEYVHAYKNLAYATNKFYGMYNSKSIKYLKKALNVLNKMHCRSIFYDVEVAEINELISEWEDITTRMSQKKPDIILEGGGKVYFTKRQKKLLGLDDCRTDIDKQVDLGNAVVLEIDEIFNQ